MKYINVSLKYKPKALFIAFLLVFSLLFSCTSTEEKRSEVAENKPTPPPKAEHIGDVSLYEKYAPYFSIGAAVSMRSLKIHDKILQFHFNHLTMENDMKFGSIQPAENTFNFTVPDAIADYAREHTMNLCGHTFVWHSQYPEWLFAGLTPGNEDDIELLKSRMKNHIETLIDRYDDVVNNWDVVNEAVTDTKGKMYRDGSEGSKWYNIFQSEEYIYWAFKYTQDVLEAKGSSAKMYYNDYNVYNPDKLKKILDMARWLRDEKGVRIDGIGFQGHWKINVPVVNEVRNAFDIVVKEGFEIKISELDVSIYPNDNWAEQKWEPLKEFDARMEDKQAEYYGALFSLFREYGEYISEVTFWGISDNMTWLDYFPTRRNNFPLLFDDNYNVKKAYYAIIDF
jgi:endo-1,4-beta-xylanase